MPDCIDCSVHLHHAAARFMAPLLDFGARQPLGGLVVLTLLLYALLALAGRFADRIDPPRPEWRPEPVQVPARDRVWRFRDAPRRRI